MKNETQYKKAEKLTIKVSAIQTTDIRISDRAYKILHRIIHKAQSESGTRYHDCMYKRPGGDSLVARKEASSS
jgi:hypothetical protein